MICYELAPVPSAADPSAGEFGSLAVVSS